MARLSQPRRTVSMVLLRTVVDGKVVHVREPYNIVALDWGIGNKPFQTYLEPAGALLHQPAPDDANSGRDLSARAEVYDEIRVYDAPPPFSRLGSSII